METHEMTLIYAYADAKMKWKSVEKAADHLPVSDIETELPSWEDADIIGRLVRGY